MDLFQIIDSKFIEAMIKKNVFPDPPKYDDVYSIPCLELISDVRKGIIGLDKINEVFESKNIYRDFDCYEKNLFLDHLVSYFPQKNNFDKVLIKEILSTKQLHSSLFKLIQKMIIFIVYYGGVAKKLGRNVRENDIMLIDDSYSSDDVPYLCKLILYIFDFFDNGIDGTRRSIKLIIYYSSAFINKPNKGSLLILRKIAELKGSYHENMMMATVYGNLIAVKYFICSNPDYDYTQHAQKCARMVKDLCDYSFRFKYVRIGCYLSNVNKNIEKIKKDIKWEDNGLKDNY